MLWNGEYYYYLGKRGIEVLHSEGLPVPARAKAPIGDTLQHHEYEVSRFWIKFWWDCERLGIEIVSFWRDGEMAFRDRYNTVTVFPDGTLLALVKDRPTLFLLELDRSTHMASGSAQTKRGFGIKVERYRRVWTSIYRHSGFQPLGIKQIHLMVVCPSEARLVSLMAISKKADLRNRIRFSCWPRLVEQTNSTATGWRYRPQNLLVDSIFSACGRSPPQALIQVNKYLL